MRMINAIRSFVCHWQRADKSHKRSCTRCICIRKLWHASRVKCGTKYNVRMLIPHQSGHAKKLSLCHVHMHMLVQQFCSFEKPNHYDKVIFNCANHKHCWPLSQRRSREHSLSSLAFVTYTDDLLCFFLFSINQPR